jgi:hypothetical protein
MDTRRVGGLGECAKAVRNWEIHFRRRVRFPV